MATNIVLLDTNFPCSNEYIHNVPPSVNPPLLSYGSNNATSELVKQNILGFVYFHPCLDQEKNISLQVIDPPTHVEDM